MHELSSKFGWRLNEAQFLLDAVDEAIQVLSPLLFLCAPKSLFWLFFTSRNFFFLLKKILLKKIEDFF